MQKKILWSIIIILAVILVVIFFIPTSKINNISDKQICDPYININSIVKSGDVKSCDCLKDYAQVEQCRTNISNATSYTNALKESDLSLCNKITDIGMVTACINLVQGKINFASGKALSATSTKK